MISVEDIIAREDYNFRPGDFVCMFFDNTPRTGGPIGVVIGTDVHAYKCVVMWSNDDRVTFKAHENYNLHHC